MQHTDARWGGRSDADEVPDPDLLHEQPEGTDVGAMEGRLDAPSDRSPVQPRTHVCPRDPGSDTGGFRPSQRIRSAKALTLAEREEISRSLADGWSLRGSPRSSGEHHQRSAANWAATVDRRAIALPRPTMPHGTARFVPSRANRSRTRPWPGSCRTSFGGCDRRSRSQDGSSIPIHATRACTCHTRPSTAASSFKRAAP